MSYNLLIFPHSRLRNAFKVSMPALGKGGWAETQFDDCSLEEMWTKMCRCVLADGRLLHIGGDVYVCFQDRLFHLG